MRSRRTLHSHPISAASGSSPTSPPSLATKGARGIPMTCGCPILRALCEGWDPRLRPARDFQSPPARQIERKRTCGVERAPSPAAFDFEAGRRKPPPLCCLGGDGSGRARLPIVPPQSPLFKGSGAPSFALFAKGEFHGCSPFGISRRRHSGPLPLSLNGAAQAGPLCFSCGRNAKHHLACGFGTGVIISILVSI